MTTQAQHQAHIDSVKATSGVASVYNSESIHRDEYDFFSIAVMDSGERFIVGYSDPAYGHNATHSTYQLGECPLIDGMGCWGSMAEYGKKKAA